MIWLNLDSSVNNRKNEKIFSKIFKWLFHLNQLKIKNLFKNIFRLEKDPFLALKKIEPEIKMIA